MSCAAPVSSRAARRHWFVRRSLRAAVAGSAVLLLLGLLPMGLMAGS